ncbi:unnamed protein product [Gadus morhua 'NCC']
MRFPYRRQSAGKQRRGESLFLSAECSLDLRGKADGILPKRGRTSPEQPTPKPYRFEIQFRQIAHNASLQPL